MRRALSAGTGILLTTSVDHAAIERPDARAIGAFSPKPSVKPCKYVKEVEGTQVEGALDTGHNMFRVGGEKFQR